MEAFIEQFNAVQQEVHNTAKAKGWWEDRDQLELTALACGKERLAKFARSQVDAACLALIHSEVSEALEASRHGNPPDDKVPEFTGMEAELADVIIRIMDLAQARGLRVAEAVVAKAAMNRGREYMHGKKF